MTDDHVYEKSVTQEYHEKCNLVALVLIMPGVNEEYEKCLSSHFIRFIRVKETGKQTTSITM